MNDTLCLKIAERISLGFFKPTLFEISIFCPKNNFDFLGEKLVKMLWFWDFLAVDYFDFTRKIVKKNLGEKLVKMLRFCQN